MPLKYSSVQLIPRRSLIGLSTSIKSVLKCVFKASAWADDERNRVTNIQKCTHDSDQASTKRRVVLIETSGFIRCCLSFFRSLSLSLSVVFLVADYFNTSKIPKAEIVYAFAGTINSAIKTIVPPYSL